MKHLISHAITIWAACMTFGLAPAFAAGLPNAHDLAADARAAQAEGIPLAILYSINGCPACEEVRRLYLNALSAQLKGKRRVLIRQVNLKSRSALTDFQGKQTTHDAYAHSAGITFVPVVQFLGVDGEELSAPLVGRMLPDFYGAYLESALDQATGKSKMQTASIKTGSIELRSPPEKAGR
jgi:hypothetical protein